MINILCLDTGISTASTCYGLMKFYESINIDYAVYFPKQPQIDLGFKYKVAKTPTDINASSVAVGGIAIYVEGASYDLDSYVTISTEDGAALAAKIFGDGVGVSEVYNVPSIESISNISEVLSKAHSALILGSYSGIYLKLERDYYWEIVEALTNLLYALNPSIPSLVVSPTCFGFRGKGEVYMKVKAMLSLNLGDCCGSADPAYVTDVLEVVYDD